MENRDPLGLANINEKDPLGLANINEPSLISEPKKGIKDILGAIGDKERSFIKNQADIFKSAGMGAAQGLANVPIGASNLLNKVTGLNKLVGTTQPVTFANKAPNQMAAKIGEFAAPIAIPFAGEEAMGVKIAEGLAKTGYEAGTAANIIGKTIARGTYGGMAGSIYGSENPDEEIKNHAVAGALMNTLGRATFEAIPFGVRSLTKFYRGLSNKGVTPSPEDAKVILDTFNNDVISYGDLVKSPKLRSFYHGFLKYIPFSGVSGKQKAAIERAEKSTGNVMGELFGDTSDGDVLSQRKHIQEKIADMAQTNKAIVSKKYDDFDAKADAVGITFKPTKTKDVATNILQKDIEGRRSGVGTTSDPAELADIAKLLQIKGKQTAEGIAPIITSNGQDISEYLPPATIKLLKEAEMATATDRPIKYSTYRTAISNWKDKASNAYEKADYTKSRNYSMIANAIDEDMQSSLEKKGLEKLYDEHKAISKEYKEKVRPFYHPEKKGMRDLINNNVNLSDTTMESILADTTNEDAIKLLPQDIKHKIAGRMLSNNISDNGDFILPRTANAYEKLNKVGVINKFLDKNTKAKLDNIVKHNELLKPAMESQKSDIWNRYYKIKNIALMAGIPFYHFYKSIISPTALAGLVTLSLAGKGTAKLLESNALKQAYITGKIPFEHGQIGSTLSRGVSSYQQSGGNK